MVAGRDLDWARGHGRRRARRVRAGGRHRSALHPLHLGHHRPAQGRGARQRRPRGGAPAARWRTIYDTGPGEVYWAASDIGWVVGHSYIVYAPLLTGCTTILYEGKPVGTPDPGAFWRVIVAARRAGRCSPRPPRSAPSRRRTRPASTCAGHDISGFRCLFLAGERLDPDTYHWAARPPGRAGDRPLVADRDGLADRGQLHGPRAAAGEAGLAHQAGAGLRRAHPRRRGRARARPPGGLGGRSACRSLPGPCRRSGTTTTATSRAT